MKNVMLIGSVFLSLLLNVGCSSNGADNDGKTAANGEELVCEYRAKTGSHMKKKTCMTKSLAQELERQNREDLRDAMRRGQTQTSTN